MFRSTPTWLTADSTTTSSFPPAASAAHHADIARRRSLSDRSSPARQAGPAACVRSRPRCAPQRRSPGIPLRQLRCGIHARARFVDDNILSFALAQLSLISSAMNCSVSRDAVPLPMTISLHVVLLDQSADELAPLRPPYCAGRRIG